MNSPEKIFNLMTKDIINNSCELYPKSIFVKWIKMAQNEAWNSALTLAAEKATVEICDWDEGFKGNDFNATPVYGVDSDSILNLKINE